MNHGIVDTDAREADQIRNAALSAGALVGVLNAPASPDELFDDLSRTLDLPSWFGRNFDALEEVMTDPDSPLRGAILVVWTDPDRLASSDPDAFATAFEVLGAVIDSRKAAGLGPLSVAMVHTREDPAGTGEHASGIGASTPARHPEMSSDGD